MLHWRARLRFVCVYMHRACVDTELSVASFVVYGTPFVSKQFSPINLSIHDNELVSE